MLFLWIIEYSLSLLKKCCKINFLFLLLQQLKFFFDKHIIPPTPPKADIATALLIPSWAFFSTLTF